MQTPDPNASTVQYIRSIVQQQLKRKQTQTPKPDSFVTKFFRQKGLRIQRNKGLSVLSKKFDKVKTFMNMKQQIQNLNILNKKKQCYSLYFQKLIEAEKEQAQTSIKIYQMIRTHHFLDSKAILQLDYVQDSHLLAQKIDKQLKTQISNIDKVIKQEINQENRDQNQVIDDFINQALADKQFTQNKLFHQIEKLDPGTLKKLKQYKQKKLQLLKAQQMPQEYIINFRNKVNILQDVMVQALQQMVFGKIQKKIKFVPDVKRAKKKQTLTIVPRSKSNMSTKHSVNQQFQSIIKRLQRLEDSKFNYLNKIDSIQKNCKKQMLDLQGKSILEQQLIQKQFQQMNTKKNAFKIRKKKLPKQSL